MNAALLNLAIRSFGPKLIRNTLSWLAGVLAIYGVSLETNSVPALIVSVIMALFVVSWSVIAKAKPSDELLDKVGDFAHAVVAMLLPAMLGALKFKGITLTGEETAEQLFMIGLLTASSAINKPDAKAETLKVRPGPSGALPMLLFACLCAGTLTACKAFTNARTAAKINAALRTSCVLFVAVFCSSCVWGVGRGYSFAAAGTNAQGIKVSATGLEIAAMNQTDAIDKVSSGIARKATIDGAFSLGGTAVKEVSGLVKDVTN